MLLLRDGQYSSEEGPTAPQARSTPKPAFLEFFAGSGLVAEALKPYFQGVWANDNSEKKATVYRANQSTPLETRSIADIKGGELKPAELAWASFPCQDLSLAGNMGGIEAERSGLVWQWLRIIDEMETAPRVLVAENVLGLVSAENGAHYRRLHRALVERGYKVGALMLDAAHWLPQSRPRIFVVAAKAAPSELVADGPTWAHSAAVVAAAHDLPGWVWWKLPAPKARQKHLDDIIEFDAEPHDSAKQKHTLALIPRHHAARLKAEKKIRVFAGYKRTRRGKQCLELRFDNTAGCLRTPEGGSSRQVVVIRARSGLKTRLLTVRETARLMGARDGYKIPGSYNDGYKAMGDAVAVPVAQHLARHLLRFLVPNTESVGVRR